ncbi:hypothetical protein [Frankia sp. CeD]|uniref:hypothetical protein n=1 Tax=Frankia sp. CeD TaxID=258230 RepID=UPI0004DD4381|nr:hypothetical protein [Frankia sp. CeD]KEZ35849.1 hypothetical protein CEDDRAFT_02845 [Frankia sp. CeD]
MARPKLAHLARRTYKRDRLGRFATTDHGDASAIGFGRRKEGRHRAGRTPADWEQAEQRLRGVYGDRLRVAGREHPAVRQALIDLDVMPEDHKRRLAEHFRGVDGGGILIGKGRAMDVYRAHNRQDLIDKVWGTPLGRRAVGLYITTPRVMAVGTDETGSPSAAQHEAGHALDHALRFPSQNRKLPVWYTVARARHHNLLHDYFAQPGGEGQRESFAEGYALWNAYRHDPDRTRKIADGLGAPVNDPKYRGESERLGRTLGEFFDTLV